MACFVHWNEADQRADNAVENRREKSKNAVAGRVQRNAEPMRKERRDDKHHCGEQQLSISQQAKELLVSKPLVRTERGVRVS